MLQAEVMQRPTLPQQSEPTVEAMGRDIALFVTVDDATPV